SNSSRSCSSEDRTFPSRSAALTACAGVDRGKINGLMMTLVSTTTLRSVVIAQQLGQLFFRQPRSFRRSPYSLTESKELFDLQATKLLIVLDGDNGGHVPFVSLQDDAVIRKPLQYLVEGSLCLGDRHDLHGHPRRPTLSEQYLRRYPSKVDDRSHLDESIKVSPMNVAKACSGFEWVGFDPAND